MLGKDLVAELRQIFEVTTDSQLASLIGTTPGRISQISQHKNVSARVLSGLVKRAREEISQEDIEKHSEKFAARFANSCINTIVEFYPIDKVESAHSANWEIFDKNSARYKELYNVLSESKGIYLFYDSSGKVIYVGKTNKRNLWSEIKSAFNRDKANLDIWKVNHPKNRDFSDISQEKRRRIVRSKVKIHDLANYVSAYSVHGLMIDKVEALFIRGIPNDLSNVRIEGQTARNVGI